VETYEREKSYEKRHRKFGSTELKQVLQLEEDISNAYSNILHVVQGCW
jgi:hypothetical protein